MDLFERYGNLLRSGGTNQLQRVLPALEGDYIRPEERTLSQMFAYARAAGAELKFQALSGQPAGDWSPLFDPLTDDTGAILDDFALPALKDSADDWPAHLALLFSFFKIFAHIQSDLNAIPARHLTYYYGDVLQLPRRHAQPDKVHVVFELARNAEAFRLEAGTALDAGKDAQGRALTYTLEREAVVTHATIASIKRLVAERDRQGRLRFFKADAVSEESWPTFGADPFAPTAAADAMVEVDLGFAISDPVLRLAQGTRRIEIAAPLTVSGAAPIPEILTSHVRVEITGEEGWFTPQAASVALVAAPAGLELRIAAEIAEGQPAVVDFDSALHADTAAPTAPWPVLRCLVRSQSGRLETLSGLAVAALDISVVVKGVTDLVVQNDQGTLVAGKPIPLFTSRPTIGSNFYIGSHEIFSKRLTGLTLHFAWQDLPPDLFAHYRQYFDTNTTDSVLAGLFLPSFTAVVDLLAGRSWEHRLTGSFGSIRLFRAGFDEQTISFAEGALTGAFAGEPYEVDPQMPEVDAYRIGTQRGFLRLQLHGPTNADLSNFGVPYAREIPFKAFGHDAFAPRYAKLAVELARWDPNAPGAGPEPALPNEPYTPLLSDLSVDYSSRSHFVVSDIQNTARFYTIGPFGYATAGADVPARLIPQFEGRAALFLGVERFSVPGTLAVLFQLDEGTATVADPPEPAEIAWSYLSGDTWIVLPPSAVIVDETRGFQMPGIVSVAVGPSATTAHTAMAEGLTWIQAQLSKPPLSVARTIEVRAQGATAIFAPGTQPIEAFADHLSAALAPNSITKLNPRRAAIRKVSQPYPSFGGRRDEADDAYFVRATERLRHRNRAVTVWDFERHVLQRFDGVFKVRCLAHSDADAQPKAGEAALVIVPNLLSSQSSNRLQPRAGETLMEEIRDFLATGVASPFATVHVIHPVFERVRVDARVAFRAGFDPGFYADQLDTDLQRFLSPWAFEEGRDIVFGTRIYRSELLKFVEDRAYVDYVTRFDLYHAFDGPPRQGVGFMEIGVDFVVGADPQPAIEAMIIGVDFVVGRPVETAVTTQPHAVLVSHSEHRIEPIFPGTEICAGVAQLGIGYMIVGLDFEVLAA